MLTKQEREEIVERCKRYFYNGETDICRYLVGHSLLDDATDEERCKAVLNCIRDFCDTSNMLELPLDKDGEVIHINDVIYDNSGEEYQVECIKFFDIGACVAIRNDDDYTITQPDKLTHKNPVTAKSLAQRIKHVLEDEATSIGVNPYVELGRIAKQLEKLGDNND